MTITPVRNTEGDISHFIAIKEHTTERKQAEESLQREQGLLRALMDNIPDFIYFKDRDSRIVRNNLAHAVALGLSDPAKPSAKLIWTFSPRRTPGIISPTSNR